MKRTKKFQLPSFGLGDDTAKIGQWHCQEGDYVKKGQDLVQVEMTKSVEELTAPWTGTIEKILVNTGDEAQTGQSLALIQADKAQEKKPENSATAEPTNRAPQTNADDGSNETIEDLLLGPQQQGRAAKMPSQSPITPADHLDTVIIGAGPGGYVAAIRAAELSQKVTVIENHYLGGVCLNVGCIPSKALIQAGHNLQTVFHSQKMGIRADDVTLDMGQLHKFKNKTVKTMTDGVASLFRKHHIQVLWGTARFKNSRQIIVSHDDQDKIYTFNHAIIATGSRPVTLPNIPASKHLLDSSGALDLQEVPTSMAIVGGGYIGCELAGAYANFGTRVTLLEAQPQIMTNFDEDLVQTVLDDFRQNNVQVLTNTTLKQVADKEDGVEMGYITEGQLHSLTVDYVVVAVGRRPNTDRLALDQAGVTVDDHGLIEINGQCQTNVNNIYAIGDVVSGPALAHKASYEGKVAAAVINGQALNRDDATIPAVCYVNTPIATTGLTEEQAQQAGFDDVATAKFPFRANGRAVTMQAMKGFVRLVYYGKAKWLLGAQIVGADAAGLIGELTLAIQSGRTVADVAATIAPHPSLGEVVTDCADLALGLPINI